MRQSRSNTGYLGQDDAVLHFGLGAKKLVDIAVTFLDGTRVERAGVRANQTITIDGGEEEEKGISPMIGFSVRCHATIHWTYHLLPLLRLVHRLIQLAA
jgi:hypothetical protein